MQKLEKARKRPLGRLGEDWAAEEYEKLGFKIIARNVRMHQYRQVGEIDIIAVKGKLIAFIEVKARLSKAFGAAEEAVGFSKQRKLVKAVKLYLIQRPQYDSYDWRIDVVAIEPKSVYHSGNGRILCLQAKPIDKSLYSVTILVNVIEDID